MLGNFIYSNPTKLYFGDEAQKNLVEALNGFGNKVMLTYGGVQSNETASTMMSSPLSPLPARK